MLHDFLHLLRYLLHMILFQGNSNVFQPPIEVKNKSSTTPSSIKQAVPPQDQALVADLPSNVEDVQAQPAEQVVDAPRPDKDGNPIPYDNNEHVLAMPNNNMPPHLGDAKSSSTRSTVAAKALSKPSLDIAQPLHVPTVISVDADQKRIIPEGVAPIPNKPAQKTETDDKDVREDVNNAFPNRYRANLIANEVANENQNAKQSLLKFDDGDKENNAVEVFDAIGNDRKPMNNDLFALNGGGNHLKANNELDSAAKANDGKVPKVYDAQDGDYDKDVHNDMQLEENDPEGEDGQYRQLI